MFSAEFEPAEANRRRAARSPIALNAELDGSHRTLCKVADISIGGVRLRTYSALRVGAKIWITIPIIGRVSATVKWADDYNAGCEFAEPISADVIETLHFQAGHGDAFPDSRSGK
ncbi:PilZ domain-containing protein [Sphingomonas aurantiaca]|uniref:PilZ domain-containing protein n=1 Tax=Sphingomonas aurantiaca TaxID=185949 RepID=UPI003356A2B6